MTTPEPVPEAAPAEDVAAAEGGEEISDDVAAEEAAPVSVVPDGQADWLSDLLNGLHARVSALEGKAGIG